MKPLAFLRKFKKKYIAHSHIVQLYYKAKNTLKGWKSDKTIVFVSLENKYLYERSGRNLYLLLNYLAKAGYSVRFFSKMPFGHYAQSGTYFRYIYAISNLKVVNKAPRKTDDKILLFDKDTHNFLHQHWAKTLKLDFSRKYPSQLNEKTYLMPFFCHPNIAKSKQCDKLTIYRNNRKRMRALFSGSLRKAYNGPVEDGKMTRAQATQAVLDRDIQAKMVHVIRSQNELEKLFEKDYDNRCIAIISVASEPHAISSGRWLDTVSSTDFFICASGIYMPMCHNVIESMAVGTIPVLEYPEWFRPPLKHMENCIAYEGQDDLIKKIGDVLRMDSEKIKQIRFNTLKYYEEYLSPNFIRNVVSANEAYEILFFVNVGQYKIGRAFKG